MTTDVSSLTIREAAARIHSREISPVELTRACLDRIQSWEPTINAFITVCADEALESSRAHEALIKSGHYLGPLHGVPVGIKDNIFVAGIRSTAGSKILADFVPASDATAVVGLKKAGAVLIGKLNLHEFATGATSDNPHFGATRNPWNPNRIPAGSSGGSGAAVAAREVLGALGTDTGGSIRLPAAANGCVGIRPTIGRVSNFNVTPLAWSLDTVGPMARTVEDAALLLEAIAGVDSHDPRSTDLPVPKYADQIGSGVNGLMIGVDSSTCFTNQQAVVRDAVRAAIDCLARLGATVSEVQLPETAETVRARLTIEQYEAAGYHEPWLASRPDDYGDDVRALLRMGQKYSSTQYVKAQRYRSKLTAALSRTFQDVDVLISPTMPFVATPLRQAEVALDSGIVAVLNVISKYTGLASLAGLPSLSVPCGFSDDGLPVAMQITGRPFEEATLFRVGHAYQSATQWHHREPSKPPE